MKNVLTLSSVSLSCRFLSKNVSPSIWSFKAFSFHVKINTMWHISFFISAKHLVYIAMWSICSSRTYQISNIFKKLYQKKKKIRNCVKKFSVVFSPIKLMKVVAFIWSKSHSNFFWQWHLSFEISNRLHIYLSRSRQFESFIFRRVDS